jgi:hypothetical protein
VKIGYKRGDYMKVLVDVIDYEILQKIKHFFIKEEEIKFIDFCDKSLAFYDFEKPYYIEEAIEGLDNVLKICDDVSWGRSKIRKKVDLNEFSLFWWLMLEIKKQREVGRKISDIEYVYEKTKDRVSIQFVDITTLNRGYEFQSPYYCIIGKSELGEFILYKILEDDSDFVFDFTYEKNKILGKISIVHNHFHPQNYDEAILYVIAWMSDNKSRFSWLKS